MFPIAGHNITNQKNKMHFTDPPASKASREVAHLTERKNLHTPILTLGDVIDPTQIIKKPL